MGEHRSAAGERLEQPIAGDHCTGGRVARGQSLRTRDDVGLVAVHAGAEIAAEPAEGTDDLVGDEQHVVLVADLPHPLEIARRRWEAPTRVLYWLEEDGRDGVRPFEFDGLGDPVRGPPAEGLEV